jgi:putative hydrolase of the HAD superfamily
MRQRQVGKWSYSSSKTILAFLDSGLRYGVHCRSITPGNHRGIIRLRLNRSIYMRYKLICFDAGFTLIEPRRPMKKSMAMTLASEGIAPTEDALHRAWEAADRWFWEEYHRPGNDTWSSDLRIKATWRHYHQLMLRELGVSDEGGRIVAAVAETHFASDNWQLYPDVLPALDRLRTSGCAIGVVSDWSSQLALILDTLGIGSYLSFVLASGAAGAAKPAARFYHMAAETGGVAPQQALMVGDSYRADVLGARAAGMDAVLLDRPGTSGPVDAPIIRSLADLPALVS